MMEHLSIGCALCGLPVFKKGRKCKRAQEQVEHFRKMYPRWKTIKRRDMAKELLEEGGININMIGEDDEERPFYLVIPGLKEFWEGRIKARRVKDIIWHEPHVFTKDFIICPSCSEKHGDKCPTCGEALE